MLAAWLAFDWSRPAFPASQIAPGGPMTSPYPSRLDTAGNGTGDSSSDGAANRMAFSDEPGFAASSEDGSQNAQPVRLKLSQLGDASRVTGLAGGPNEKTAVRAEETAPAAPTGEYPFSLQLAPVQLWGNIGYELRRETIDNKKYMLQSLTTKVNASTFIWQPWFAQVSGGLGFTTSTSSTADGQGASNFVTGSADLSLLPYSRFPFEAHFDRSDSRLNTGLGAVSSAYQTTRFGLTQRYRNPSGDTQYMASYNRNLWESADFGEDKQDMLRLEMTRRLANQTFQINGDITKNDRPRTNESSLLNTLVARHSYTPDPTLSVENLASLTKTNYRLTQGESDLRYLQLSSFGFWRPTGKPLTVTGSVRLFGLNSDSSSAPATQTRSASANLGGNYDLTRNTRLNASVNVNMTDNNGVRTVTSDQSAGANYQSDTFDLGAFRYSGFASGSLSNRTDSTDSGQHLTLQAGHSLNRSTAFGGGTLGLNLNQSASSDFDTHTPANNTDTHSPVIVRLSHSGSLTWNDTAGQKTTFLRLSASDSRAVSGAQDFFQILNLQASRNESLGRNVSWAGNLTIQAARQGTGATPATTVTTSSADLSYRHQRAFGVPRLRFVSELRIYGDAPLPMLASPQEQETRSWENRLDYSIGRLDLRLSARISEVNKKQSSLLMFTLNRQFGGP